MRIWAPRAHSIELDLLDEGRRHPLSRSPNGVFTDSGRPIAGAYMLSVDGEPMVDPWAAEVDDLLGPCRQVDHATHPWTDAAFAPTPLERSVIYELHIGTFTEAGTFDGAVARLSYLRDLGITHVEIMPVATFSGGRGWGYDGAVLSAPHPAYGGSAGLKRFVDRAHSLGLSVLLDVVYNHLGPIGNCLERLGPFFDERRTTPWGAVVNMDGTDSDEVRRFFIDNALSWLRDYHIDGLRLDAIHAIEDRSATHFLEQLSVAVQVLGQTLGKQLVLIAESDLNDPRTVRTVAAHGHGMDAQWSDDFHHAMHVALTQEASGYYVDFSEQPLRRLAEALTRGFVYQGQYSQFRRRQHGRPLGDVPLSRLIGYAQNHDQVGNRARGERLSQLVRSERLALPMTLLLTGPFIPLLFMGEEWGASTPFLFFTDHQDPEVGRATREGRRAEFAAFGWRPEQVPDPQAEATFAQTQLHFGERLEGQHAMLLAYTKQLIALRRAEADLRRGNFASLSVRVDESQQTLCMERGRFLIICNFGAIPARLVLEGRGTVAAAPRPVELEGNVLRLPVDGAVVLAR
jgi:maltooligosyltrehalose trehalohydrolase